MRLSFAKTWWTAAGKRSFSISINNANVLTNFDVFAAAGERYKAVAQTFTATASTTGTIAVSLTAVTNNAIINGIEILSGSGSTPTPTPTTSPSSGFNDYATFGYDNGRDAFNPNSTAITPAALPKLHLAWQSSIGAGD